MSEAERAIRAATTDLGVVDYAKLAVSLRDAPTELWGEVARLLGERGEAEAWERYLGVAYPQEAPTELTPPASDGPDSGRSRTR